VLELDLYIYNGRVRSDIAFIHILQFICQFRKSKALPGSIDLTTKWYHIVLHVDNSTSKLLIDDIEVLFFNHSYSVALTEFNVTLGGTFIYILDCYMYFHFPTHK
jgi:hypothetical protein